MDDHGIGVELAATPAQSELSQWYQRRFGQGNKRLRKVGIIALARKLLIALWKYVEGGEPPAKAVEVGWDNKARFAAVKTRRRKQEAQVG